MKISKLGGKNQTGVIGNSREKVSRAGDFFTALEFANKEHTEERLKDMYRDIENMGKKLISTRSLEDAKEYRRKVQEYLGYIIKNVYVLKREPGPFNYGVHVRIEVINKKLDDLTKELIFEQKETIELADKIEEIRGLLIDAYK